MASDLEALLAKRTTGLMQPQLKPAIEKHTRRQFPEGIAAHGTDALRFTLAALATPTREIRFDLARVEGYRKFCNKLWNAARFVMLMVEVPETAAAPRRVFDRGSLDPLAVRHACSREVESAFKDYRFDFAASALYQFTWYEFCDWYLELTKPVLQSTQASAGGAQRRPQHAPGDPRGAAARTASADALHHRGDLAEGRAARRPHAAPR